MSESSMLPNILFHLLSLHECKFAIHVLSKNETRNDNEFMSQFSASNASILVQDSNIDMSYNMNINGKACIMSFNESALEKVPFENRRKRPIKILLGGISTIRHDRTDYEPGIVEQPPIISILQASSIHIDSFNE